LTAAGWAQLVALLVLIAVSTPLLGAYMARVYGDGPAPGDRVFLPLERFAYRILGVDREGEQGWREYATGLLLFSLVGVLVLYAIYRLQGHLPFNPDHMRAVSPGLSFNSAISFATTTDWTNYSSESTLSQLSAMLGIVVQMFVAAAVGMVVVVALTRGLARRRQRSLGSFWVDTVRTVIRILLPLSFVFAVVLMSQGVIDNFHAARPVTTVAAQVAGASGIHPQVIPGGPVASQDTIEMLGNNGGGYFNANMGHPYQNPNPITNLLLLWLSVMIPFAFPYTFGRMVGSLRQGVALLASMVVLFVVPALVIWPLEAHGNPKVPSAVHVSNLEGKETRFGTAASALSTAAETPTTSGAPNSALESYVPLSGGVALTNILLGEVSPGGDGSGMFGKLILALLSVFIAGLMIGRTPEYLGKKIQAAEMKLIVLYLVAVPAVVLVFAGASVVLGFATGKLSAAGPHGLTEVVYAYASSANGNGSSFGGFSGNTQWYNVTLAVAMFVGRYVLIIPVLALAGSLGRKRVFAATAGTLRTDTPLFVGLLLAVTVVLVGLTFFPLLALGPIVEHLAGHR
jgi:K+-transporting ATPase ATPase A chain